MDIDHVNKAIVENYRKMRTRIGIITLAFPIIVIGIGYYWGISLQPTLSNYYFATDPVGTRFDLFPVRLWFCGTLFVVGFFLYRYEGFSRNENRWLSAAGFFCAGVAMFPMTLGGRTDYPWVAPLSLHGIFAVLAFVCIAIVIFWYSESTLAEIKDTRPAAYKRFKTIYIAIAVYMALSIGTSVLLHYLNKQQGSYILFAEWSGIWAFAAYWFVKNYELRMVATEMKKRGEAMPRKSKADLADAL